MDNNNKEQQQQKPKKQLNTYARFSGIAFQMIAIIALGAFAGVKLDETFPNNYQLFTLICSLFAVAISMYYVIKQVKKPSNKS